MLEVTPNNTWPATVFYHSFSRPHMGWQLHIVDELPELAGAAATGGAGALVMVTAAVLVIVAGV